MRGLRTVLAVLLTIGASSYLSALAFCATVAVRDGGGPDGFFGAIFLALAMSFLVTLLTAPICAALTLCLAVILGALSFVPGFKTERREAAVAIGVMALIGAVIGYGLANLVCDRASAALHGQCAPKIFVAAIGAFAVVGALSGWLYVAIRFGMTRAASNAT